MRPVIFGAWREGPWMALRESTLTAEGGRRKRPVYVIELKMPGQPYARYEFGSRMYRDVWARAIRLGRRWRAAEEYRVTRERMQRRYL